jgi:hypothetical protein
MGAKDVCGATCRLLEHYPNGYWPNKFRGTSGVIFHNVDRFLSASPYSPSLKLRLKSIIRFRRACGHRSVAKARRCLDRGRRFDENRLLRKDIALCSLEDAVTRKQGEKEH